MKRVVATALATIAMWSTARVSKAQDIVAGWEGDDTKGYVFLTPTAAIDVTASQSILLRGTGSFLYYGSQVDRPIDVTAPGAGVAAGYRAAGPRVNFTAFAGFEERRIRRAQSAGGTTQWEHGPSFSAQIFAAPTRLTQISALANYGRADQYTWFRAGAKRQITNTNFTAPRALGLGFEVTAQGNRDVTSYQVGGLFDLAWLGAKSSLQLRAGYARSIYPDSATQERPYVGIGIYRGL